MHFKRIGIIKGVIVPPTIFHSLLSLSLDDAQSHLPDDYIDENKNEILFPLNRGNYHWILIRLLKNDKSIEIYDPMHKDKCKKEIIFLSKIESFFERNVIEVYHMRDFPKQNDDYNCGIIILTICYQNFQFDENFWKNYDELRRMFRDITQINISNNYQ